MDKHDPQTNNESEWLDRYLDQSIQLPPASAEFCAKVMKDIHSHRLPWQVRLRRFMSRPYQIKWNIKTGLVTAGLAAAVVIGIGGIPRITATPKSLNAPVAVNVRFQLQLEGVQQVALAGNFSQWQSQYKLKKNAQGIWTVEIPLESGRHEYMFVVDGKRWISDPLARQYQDDGFGGRNSVVIVGRSSQSAGAYRHAI